MKLQIQQLGVDIFHREGIGPKTGFDVHLGVDYGILGGDGYFQILASSAHANSGVDGVGAEFNRQTQQLLVADVAVGLTVQVQTKAAGDAVGRTLTVDIDTTLITQTVGLLALGTDIIDDADIVCGFAMGTLDSDFCCHDNFSFFNMDFAEIG